ncbi:unnamed protein product [Polarella glacialis]|uniref:Uncharacterized protein n=3 Tax=Polarella glacialis TaxID=89957 RepID=A0A813DJD2_POLGL|nr:unnamed protein product [Polarella glacialis]
MLRLSAMKIARQPGLRSLQPSVAGAMALRGLSTSASPMSQNVVRYPTLDEVRKMPTCFFELPSETLFLMAESGSYQACEERLIRDVMRVDGVEWPEANKVVHKMAAANDKMLGKTILPHKLGISTAVVSGIVSIPLIFHLPTVELFNRHFVTSDVPEPKDLETFWEIGAWSWNWMEPVLGTASFVLLTMQFTRNLMVSIDMQPWTSRMRSYRADQLAAKYPQYNRNILRDFVKTAPFAQRLGGTPEASS